MTFSGARNTLGDVVWIASILYVVAVQPLYLRPIEQTLPIVLGLVLVGVFLKRPLFGKRKNAGPALRRVGDVVDGALVLASALATGFVATQYAAIIFRQGAFTQADLVVSVITVVLVLEAIRRTVGWPLVVVCFVFLAYALSGPYLAGPFLHRGYSVARTSQQLTLSYGGIYGIPLQVMLRYVILFIVFGAILQASGAADFLVKFAQSIAGRYSGGLGKVAVLASGLIGSISGSAAGNVATTGSVTIPAMKRAGYPPHVAAAIESVASTGGQLMPPVMGAAAFLMAEYLGIPYARVALAAIIPAIFYYLAAMVFIDLYARKNGIRGLPRHELPPVLRTIREGWPYLILLALVYGLLIAGFSPTRAAFIGIIAASALALVRRVGLRTTLQVLRTAAASSAVLCAVTAGAGIVVGVVQLTGLGATLAGALVDASFGNVVVLLLLVMVASIVMGMGMPTTVVYVLLATLVAPALRIMGIEPLSAHFFFLYFGVLAAITPPVALASYAAASIAESPLDKTAWRAFTMALPSFIVPFFFVFNPALLLIGTPLEVVHAAITGAVGIFLFSAAIINHLAGPLRPWMRALLLGAAILLIEGGWVTDLTGLVVLAIVVFVQRRAHTAAGVTHG